MIANRVDISFLESFITIAGCGSIAKAAATGTEGVELHGADMGQF